MMISLAMKGTRCQNTVTDCTVVESLNPKNEFEEIVNIAGALHATRETFITESQAHLNNSRVNVGTMFRKFSATCRKYTDVLVFKDQLQKQLFSNPTQQDDILLSLSSLIINLQKAAMKLQEIEIKMTNNYCVTFTSEQYELIYFSRLHTQGGLVISLLKAGLRWQNKKRLCERWEEYN